MITRTVNFTIPKDILDSMTAEEADRYIKRKALDYFFDELVQHIEPKYIDEQNYNYYMDNMVSFQFELTGGSLPDHESNT